ncbi:hypothetical protein COT50_02435 [candidate division WWE3 bacterium CG08_land_8_20_14_0_20_41_10]|uniref:Polymerase beta nucleotidyltransferase domain-containing protein n=1 Tax=candidate division WWE3 bacterium CG08_land_8_20_14_0_20_41_10 TaxID=1975085 RepID=A0A2H0XBM4_UNCKA|nr:MAG: hypothetical protein COT50_02435 [candidate division WWE3 bacterium CG08_land_8_20_14_0_20_41_10]
MNELFASTQLKNICQQNGISYLGLFGSYARGEQKDASDVDLLVKFKSPVGYFTLVDVQNLLEAHFKREVDLVTENALSKYMRPKILEEVQTLYGSR